ncbi:MAG: LysR family transcriptional regulator [Acidiferrobacterales bacterium]|nr:LysR family transcriptional regulator [Acidiferrobacterales bacterium]
MEQRSLKNIDINRLRIFSTVVSCGGFAPAAERLGMSDASISIHMSKLETSLGAILCTRGRGGFELTPEGEKIHEASLALMLSLDSFTASVGAAKGQLIGNMHLGVIDNTVFDFNLNIPEVVKRVKEIAPDIEISIDTQSPSDLCQGVLNQNLHLAVGVFYEHHPGLKYIPLCDEKMTLYCGKHHALYRSRNLTVDDIEKHPFVERNYGSTLSNVNIPLEPRVSAFTSSLEATLLLILSGEYIGFLPNYYAQQWSDSGEIRTLLSQSLHVKTEVSALVHPRPVNAQITELLLNLVIQSSAGLPDS